jgi:hypothetical protein
VQPAFGDPEFRRRLAKLLAMLSTENPAEAEAARHKLLEHLAARHLSMIDLAQHLTAAPAEPDRPPPTRETERLRAANQALERAVRRSRAEALAALQRATLAERELGRRRSRRVGRNAAAGWVAVIALAALAAGAGAVGWTWLHAPGFQGAGFQGLGFQGAGFQGAGLHAPVLHPPVSRAAPPAPERLASARPAPPRSLAPAPPAPDRPVFSWQPEATPSAAPAARAAFVRIDQTALREGASPDATLRAVLPRGLPVVVLRTERRAGQDWSLVQTPRGEGYVAAAAIATQ